MSTAFNILRAFLAFAAVSVFAREPLVRLASIPLHGVEGRLDHLAYDNRSQRLFVAALESHSVEVVDLARRRRSHRLTGINEPQGLLYVAEQDRLLVCSRGDGTIRSFDATTLVEGPWIDLGRNADNARFDPEARVVYVGSAGEPGNGLFSAIDLASLLPVAQGGRAAPPRSPADFLLSGPREGDPKHDLQLPSHPESFQLDLANRRALVNLPDGHEIAVLSLGTDGIHKVAAWPFTLGEKNFPMALDATSNRLFVACRKPARLAVYDTRSGTLVAQTPCVGDADDMFYEPQSGRLYIIGGEGLVDVFRVFADAQTPERLAQVRTAPRARTGLLMSERNLLAVAVPHFGNGGASVLLFQTAP